MGTPIPSPDPEYGVDCPHCTPALWPVGKTPASVYIYFSGLISCNLSPFGPPNGLTFRLDQQVGSPCWFRHSGAVWECDWYPFHLGKVKSYVQLMDTIGWGWFSGALATCPPEYTIFPNDQFQCLFMWAGAMGTATVFWMDKVLQLVEQFGFETVSNLMYEMFNHDDGDIVHKFCDIVQRTNIKIKATP